MINTPSVNKKNSIKRFISFALIFAFVFLISSCGSSFSDKIEKNSTWETETDADNSSIKWVFEGNNVNYINVINGEEMFSQSFNYSIEDNKLLFKSNYATLTFEATIDGENMTVKTESGEILVFKKK